MLSDFIVTMVVIQAVLLTACSLYCFLLDLHKEKLLNSINRKFWIYVQEDKFNDVMQQEWESEMKDKQQAEFERLVECEEVKLWD